MGRGATATAKRSIGQCALDLDLRRPEVGRGGWRRKAGRKRGDRVSHGARERFSARHPVHVTMKVVQAAARLRRRDVFRVVRASIAGSQRAAFRVCEFNVMQNHVHIICEAGGARELGNGMRRLATRMALGVNRRLGRKGRVFADRYHVRVMRSPRQVRNSLIYVLRNSVHHGGEAARLAFDPWSSAASFAGWAEALPRDAAWMRAALAEPPATAPAKTWLLATGWRRHGAIRIDEAPAVVARR